MQKQRLQLKNINQFELSEAYNRVQRYFFAFPNEAIGLNDLSLSIKLSKTSTKEAVLDLEKKGFLNREEIGKAWRITANIKHPYFLTQKVPLHLQMIYDSGAIDLIREKYPSAKAIILFGSYRNGTDEEKSDIDIAVEMMDNEKPRIEQLGIIENLGFRRKVLVNLFIFSRNKVDINLFNNIANGIVLDGFLEVRT